MKIRIWRFQIAVMLIHLKLTLSDLVWTPILPTQPDQVDLWTLSQSGCSCIDGAMDLEEGDCACCVPRSACPCGVLNPHRCAQCGLQRHCNNMCNMTIDGSLLSVSAGTLEGSLVSPTKPGPPIYCWYSLRAPPGHRIEIQLHRLVHIGSSLNGTDCSGGYVEISDEERRSQEVGQRFRRAEDVRWTRHDGAFAWSGDRGHGHTTLRVCGQDQRLHPPVVIFSDSGIATILYRVSVDRGSPRFIAYYNFPPVTHPQTGDMQWGGSKIDYTVCDWLYQDIHCRKGSECHLTSPGYPGIYPSERKCKYLFTMESPSTEGRLKLIAVDFPPERCSTDNIAIYAGTSTSTPLISRICGGNKQTVNFHGPNALLVFSSGAFVLPYQFNGFHASLYFHDDAHGGMTSSPSPTSTTASAASLPAPTVSSDMAVLRDPSRHSGRNEEECLRVFWSNASRSGRFDTSSSSHFSSPSSPTSSASFGRRLSSTKLCKLRFVGKSYEVVQISFFKYRLGGGSCSSEISVYDGEAAKTVEGGRKIIHHICGPLVKEPKDANGKFVQPEFLISSSNVLEIHLRYAKHSDPDRQFLTGAYQFHSSRLEGTKKPDSVCDVMFYGANSPREGKVRQPESPLLWNMEGQLTCSYFFVPGANQSLQLTVESITGTRGSSSCETKCLAEGCQCHTTRTSLDSVDHLLLVDSKHEKVMSCFCGDVRTFPPITFLATSGVDVRYHIGLYSWTLRGFNFTLSFQFPPATLCGNVNHNTPAGLLVPPSDTAIAPSVYIFTTCSWVVENQADTQLTIVAQPPSHGSCATWNLRVEARVRGGEDNILGNVCGGGSKGSFYLSLSHSAALLHLQRGGRTVRDWLLTWHTKRSGVELSEGNHQFTPKPESSRTLHGHPTGRTFIVRSSSGRLQSSRWQIIIIVNSIFLLDFSNIFLEFYSGIVFYYRFVNPLKFKFS